MGIKYGVNENFFKTWSPEMAYLLGFIAADGCIYTSARGHYTVLTSTDESIIINAKRWLQSEHTINTALPMWANGKLRYVLRIGNKKIYEDLLGLGIYPSKSLTIRVPLVPREFLKDFVRGNFDGDGCVYLSQRKGKLQALIIEKLSVIFTSGSKPFLEGLLGLLRNEVELKQTKIYPGSRCFQLRFVTADSMRLFKFMYKDTPEELFFQRKYKIFETYFSLRPQRIDKEVQNILHYSSAKEGLVAK